MTEPLSPMNQPTDIDAQPVANESQSCLLDKSDEVRLVRNKWELSDGLYFSYIIK